MSPERCATFIAGFEGFRGFVYDDTTWPSRAVTPGECRRVGGQYKVIATGGIATLAFGETDADYIDAHWAGISQSEAWPRFVDRVVDFADAVANSITHPMTAHQHEAMTSLAYNIGKSGFASSTVCRKFNAGDITGARAAFLLWVIPTSLLTRRKAEQSHFDIPEENIVVDLANLHPTFRARVNRAVEVFGVEVYSGARSTKRQAQLYQDYLAGVGNPANPPGTSWHEYGAGIPGGDSAQAVDFLTGSTAAESALAALQARAAEFGLVFNIRSERWHAQPIEIAEPARVPGAGDRLPAPPSTTPQEENDMAGFVMRRGVRWITDGQTKTRVDGEGHRQGLARLGVKDIVDPATGQIVDVDDFTFDRLINLPASLNWLGRAAGVDLGIPDPGSDPEIEDHG